MLQVFADRSHLSAIGDRRSRFEGLPPKTEQFPQDSPPAGAPLHAGALPSALLQPSAPPPSDPLHESLPSALLQESLSPSDEPQESLLPSSLVLQESPPASLPLLQAPSPAASRLLPSQSTVTLLVGVVLTALSVSSSASP